MCLYVGNKITLKAKQDITVYKVLTKKDNEWLTPYQGAVVKLNDTMKTVEVKELHKEFWNKFKIEGGAIHTYTSSGTNVPYFKAIIKAGTTYYLQDDFKEVAAEELYITDEEVNEVQNSPDFNVILNDYLEAVSMFDEYKNKDGVCVGDIRLSTGEYVKPTSDFNKDKAIGVVAFFKPDGTPVVVALEGKDLPWLTQYNKKNEVYSQITSENYLDDMDGKKHTEDIVNGKDYNPDEFKAIDYCHNYKTDGTKIGDWYLGSTGEMVKVAQNIGLINASMFLSGVGECLELAKNCTSSEYKSVGYSCAWYCDLDDGCCGYYHYYRYYYVGCRPLASFA